MSIGLQGEIVSTPGHSADSISVVLDEGIAFTSDLLSPFMVSPGEAGSAEESWNKCVR
ncbi:MAG: hypothetical protein NTV14_00155 [Coprothermobacterota bacterium]|nr:hypothetical protein [Coprothermobacterota bacterium]